MCVPWRRGAPQALATRIRGRTAVTHRGRGCRCSQLWAFVPAVRRTEAPEGYVHREPEKVTFMGIRLSAPSPLHLLQGHRPLFSGPH